MCIHIVFWDASVAGEQDVIPNKVVIGSTENPG